MEYLKIVTRNDEENTGIIILKETTSAFQLEVLLDTFLLFEIKAEIKNKTCNTSFLMKQILDIFQVDIWNITMYMKNNEKVVYAKMNLSGQVMPMVISHAIINSIHFKVPIIITEAVAKCGYYGDTIEEKDFKMAKTENLKKILENILTNENYEKAGKIRDELNKRKRN